MIGVACVLEGACADPDEAERAGFVRAVRTLSEMRGRPLDEALLERTADAVTWHGFPHPDLALAFSAALGPTPADELTAIDVEAYFRMAGAQAVSAHFSPFPDAVATLRELATMQIPRVLVSTSWSGIAERKAAALEFDGPLLLAEEIAADPASPQGLARIALELRLPADRIWFVASDLRRLVMPAQAAGMHGVWLDRAGRSLPAGTPAPEAAIASFDGLLPMLAEPYTRGLLALRYMMRSVLEWRPGHFIPSNDPISNDASTSDDGR